MSDKQCNHIPYPPKRDQAAYAKLVLLKLSANVEQNQIGYWDDLAYDQGAESIYKAERIAAKQEDKAIAEEIMAIVTESTAIAGITDTTTIKVNGVWYLDRLPGPHAIAEFEDGRLAKFLITKTKPLAEEDFTAYKGYHPRKCKGNPMPEYMYKFYGFEKSNEFLTEVVHVRLKKSEKENLEKYGKNQNPPLTASEVVRNYVRTLCYKQKNENEAE